MNKKGDIEKDWLITLIIVALLAIILFSGYSVFFKEADTQSKIEKCRMEVIKASKSNKLPGFDSHAECPIIKEGVVDLPNDEKEAKQKLANKLIKRMKTCWGKFGEGKISPYPSKAQFQNSHCYICSTFKTPKEIPGGEWKNFNDFLSKKLKEDNESMKYLSDALFRYGEKGEDIHFMMSGGIDYEDSVWDVAGRSFIPVVGPTLASMELKEGVEPDEVETEFDKYFSGFPIEKNKKYYLIISFVVEKDNAIWNGKFFNTHETYSKIAFMREETVDQACSILEN